MSGVWRTQGLVSFPPAWRAGRGVGDGAPPTNQPGIEENAPPSSYAVSAVLDGESGAVVRLIGLTALRGIFIIPGLWVASKVLKTDLDTWDVVGLSFAGSVTISAGMLGYYYVRRITG